MAEKDEVFKQDLEDEGDFQQLFRMYLLFENKGPRPAAEDVRQALERTFGETDLVADAGGSLSSYAVKKFPVEYKDRQRLPAQVLLSDFAPFEAERIDRMQRSQFWDCPEWEALLEKCGWQLMLSDFMAAGLPYKERCALLTGWLETAAELFPDCLAVWVPSSGKLLTRQTLLQRLDGGEDSFLHFGVNARFFRIQGAEDFLVDTLGLYAVGLPDIQYHFHGLDPNAVVTHAYSAASYVFLNDSPIKSGETIDGLANGRLDKAVQWRCRYETALIQPKREVVDIEAGEYASGGREYEDEK